MTTAALVVSLQDQLLHRPSSWSDTGSVQLDCGHLPAGLYRCKAMFDAAAFDWQRLYLPMTCYNNAGQRTGPWDFDFDQIQPLVPAWWATLNHQPLGLAVVARPSPAQLAHHEMSLVFCFELTHAQPVILTLQPFNDVASLRPLHWLVETEREDVPAPVALAHPHLHDASYARHQVDAQIWQRWQAKLPTLDDRYAAVLARGIAAAKRSADQSPDTEMLKLLCYAWRAHDDAAAAQLACRVVSQQVAMDHWGNPCPSGYGHDADMGVAARLENLSFAYHWLGSRLDGHEPGLHDRLRSKLQLQMDRFYTAILLWAGYWGGSLMQDHGHRSISRFGVAAINLLGVLDRAPHWLAFAHQRLQRVIRILPADGGIPFSSYFKVHLYMDDLLTWRDALKHAAGQDLYDNPLFPRVLDGVIHRLDLPQRQVMTCLARGDRKHFYAGWGFFNAIAAHTRTGQGVTLTHALLDDYLHLPIPQRPLATMLAMIDHADPSLPASPLTPAVFDHRPAIGQVNYRPSSINANVALRCSIPAGLPAIFELTSPCDRIIDAPLEGHFSVHVQGENLLLTAEGGYRMRASLGCALHIDGQGAYEDKDYAMGVPGVSCRGQRIEIARYDPATQQAFVRMNLAPAYARENQLLRYVREFHLSPTGMVFRDLLLAQQPHHYSWHFHSYASAQADPLDDACWRISQRAASLTLAGQCLESPLKSARHPTEVVWSYDNEHQGQSFTHVKFETVQSSATLSAEFSIQWA